MKFLGQATNLFGVKPGWCYLNGWTQEWFRYSCNYSFKIHRLWSVAQPSNLSVEILNQSLIELCRETKRRENGAFIFFLKDNLQIALFNFGESELIAVRCRLAIVSGSFLIFEPLLFGFYQLILFPIPKKQETNHTAIFSFLSNVCCFLQKWIKVYLCQLTLHRQSSDSRLLIILPFRKE